MSKLLIENGEGLVVDVLEDATPTPSPYYGITITDKTVAEAQNYLDEWKNQPQITQLQFDTQTNRRRLLVSGGMVSVSGKNAFTRERFDIIHGNLESIGLPYTTDPVYVSHTPDSFTFDVTVAPADIQAAQAVIIHEYEQMVADLARWRVTPDTLIWLSENGGEFSGTASQVGPRLQDGLLT